MKDLSLSSVAQMMQAKFSGPDARYQAICTDTRHLKPGDLFVALEGQHVDGHDYINIAEKRGAAGLVVSRPSASTIATLLVPNTLEALALFAKAMRARFPIPMVAITGSSGKTTIKEMLYSILSLKGSTLATTDNLNNEIGVPLTLSRLNPEHWAAVIEMGARREGDIAYLMSLADPSVGLISNASMAHVAIFGSTHNIAEAKGEIYKNIKSSGIAILNVDEAHADRWRSMMHKPAKIISFGLKNKADVYADNIILDKHGSFCDLHIEGKALALTLQAPGEHSIYNALAAAAAATALGVELETIQKGLQLFSAVSGRLEFKKGRLDTCIIDDTYNANPASMQAALAVLARQPGFRIFVMGDMLELGDQALDYHQIIGLAAQKYGIHKLYGFGKMTRAAVAVFGEGGSYFMDQNSLIEKLLLELPREATLLVKGSRGMQMEHIVARLINDE
ncbi:MAG: UDP-N-acetylmuramoyl-tripeptide--D-alanyl-D-alanine ligase [Gammaproteobacteria bacterium]|nr:UDP-N-acetylmuramoyl-tripeptide--D-alanyl-D-alanine ligase [Gammaproteobacteria bacterium]MBP9729535.1 UDP-N-acetylmuramoyl-tripeptide--D-alanyl-D-alanine ligase [Gammaproteobacteria bacterium]